MKYIIASALLSASVAYAQQPVYAQCGGIGWTGGTTCASGSSCVVSNSYYSQCLPGAAPAPANNPPPPASAPAPAPAPATTPAPAASPAPAGSSATGSSAANTLNSKFVSHGKKFWGVATDQNRFSVSQNNQVIVSDFGGVTPENSMKWDATEPNQGQFSFSGSDALVNYAVQNGKLIRGHTFVWAQQTPGWVTSLSSTAMQSAIKNHITTVMTRYQGKIYGYDVVNEHINEDGSIKSTPFTSTIGNSVFTLAYQTARAADPNAKLYINDYNLDSNNAKVGGIVKLVNQLNANGAKLVDGIGSQSHLSAGQTSGVQAALTALAAANVEVAITELDIINAAASDYTAVAKACLAVSSCVSITSWGVRDPDSWRASNNPLLFDANYQPKAAYTALMSML